MPTMSENFHQRHAEWSQRYADLHFPRASTIGFGKWKVSRGDWIVFRERLGPLADGGEGEQLTAGRVIARVEARRETYTYQGKEEVREAFDGLAVLCPKQTLDYVYMRWVRPEAVQEIRSCPSGKLLAWLLGDLPKLEEIGRLHRMGALTDEYIEKYATK